ncbi:hypothetical protein [Halofilum ochraceum]|uniref:hypothetical protein n=1 Tax=Halofilum ochraceum TaxID=1611323 RepID=UPI0008D9392F|nr:hypothetical protein [Halofilum ochraceum]
MEFRFIQYIGRKPRKRDTLYQTGVVWAGYGDIQPVAADVAPRLLSHTDAFVEVDRETYEAVRDQAEQSIDTSAFERARQRVAAGGAVTTDGSALETGGDGTDGGSGEDPADDGSDAGEGEADSGDDDAGGLADADTGEGESEEEPERGPQKPEKPVSQLGKSKLAEYADREFGETIDVTSMDVEAVRNRVRELMAEHGVK